MFRSLIRSLFAPRLRARPAARLLLEALEDRCVPTGYSWTGGGSAGNWADPQNWGQDPETGHYPSGTADWANFNGGTSANFTVSSNVPSALGGLHSADAHLTLKINGTLTVGNGTGGGNGIDAFNWDAGSIVGTSGASNKLVLSGSNPTNNPPGSGSNWSSGDIGDGVVAIELDLTNATVLNAGSSTTPPVMDGDLNVGETSGTVTACQFIASNEVDLGTDSLSHHVNVYGDGTTAATFEEDTTSGDCTLGGGNSTDLQNVVSGKLVLKSTGTTVRTVTDTIPLSVTGAGAAVTLYGYVTMSISNKSATLPAVQIGDAASISTFVMGVANLTNNTGNCKLVTSSVSGGLADVDVASSSSLRVVGLTNKISLKGGTGASWQVKVQGYLTLGVGANLGGFVQSNLTVDPDGWSGRNDVNFVGSNSHFYFDVDTTAGAQHADTLTLQNGNVSIDTGTTYSVFDHATTSANADFTGLITCVSGTINRKFQSDPAKWTNTLETGSHALDFAFTA
jgi:hypothetical protein